MEIIIQPLLTEFDKSKFDNVADEVSREFEYIRVTVSSDADNIIMSSLKKDAAFQSSFDTHRNQWNSAKLIQCLFDKFRPIKDRKILVILDVDWYSDGLNFVLAEAFPNGGLGIVYLPRIKEEFYGQKRNDKLFYERMVKECVHELGHVFGFAHCHNKECVMHFSNTLSDTDIKRKSFCDNCGMKEPIF
jgi:archaemetzincin